MRSMFLHSFQSYLWNLAASHRVATHGAEKPVLGDLVLPQALDSQTANAGIQILPQKMSVDDVTTAKLKALYIKSASEWPALAN